MCWAPAAAVLKSWPSWLWSWNSCLLSCQIPHCSRPNFFLFFRFSMFPKPNRDTHFSTQCVRGVLDPPVSAFSLSLYRHPFLYTLFSSRFTLIINNTTFCHVFWGPNTVNKYSYGNWVHIFNYYCWESEGHRIILHESDSDFFFHLFLWKSREGNGREGEGMSKMMDKWLQKKKTTDQGLTRPPTSVGISEHKSMDKDYTKDYPQEDGLR